MNYIVKTQNAHIAAKHSQNIPKTSLLVCSSHSFISFPSIHAKHNAFMSANNAGNHTSGKSFPTADLQHPHLLFRMLFEQLLQRLLVGFDKPPLKVRAGAKQGVLESGKTIVDKKLIQKEELQSLTGSEETKLVIGGS